jgi:hypothetical protein
VDNAERRNKKEAIHSILEQSPLDARHYPGLQKITKTAKTAVAGIANDDVVEDFDLEKLAGADEVAGDFYVSFRRCWITAPV